MIDEKFVYVAAVLILLGDLSYLIDTIKGKITPHKITWFLWAFAALIAFFAQLQQGVGIYSLMTLSVGLIPALIFLASLFNRKASWKITTFDLFCGLLSLIGLILWGITQVGNLAILFSILSDGLAAVPTIIKSYQAPETENYHAFLFSGIGAAITLLTVKEWNFANSAFAVYIFIVCILIFLLIKFKIGKWCEKYA